jgi:hypothetical protein
LSVKDPILREKHRTVAKAGQSHGVRSDKE